MNKYLVSALANNVVADHTIYAKSEEHAKSKASRSVLILNVKSHPVKDGFLKRLYLSLIFI